MVFKGTVTEKNPKSFSAEEIIYEYKIALNDGETITKSENVGLGEFQVGDKVKLTIVKTK